MQDVGNLVVSCPVAPLLAVNRAEVALLVRPFVPDGYAIIAQVTDVGLAAQEPQQFMHDGFEMHTLGGEQREPVLQVQAHLVAENGARPRAGTVSLGAAVLQHMAQKVKIRLHAAPVAASATGRRQSSAD